MNDVFIKLNESDTVQVFIDGRVGITLDDGYDECCLRMDSAQAREVAKALALAADTFDKQKAKP